MKFPQQFATILSVILACVVGGGLLVLTAENAQAQSYRAYRVPAATLSYDIPVNPNSSYTVYYNPETAFGAFAWQAFVALNWPAACDGSPLTDKKIGEAPNAPRVWEFYKFPEDVFNPNGEQPNLTSVIPPPCPGSDAGTQHLNLTSLPSLRLTEFESDLTLDEIVKLAFPKIQSDPELSRIFPDQKSVHTVLEGFKPLVDRQGNYILNEIRMNPVEVAQIVDKKWYRAENLQQFNDNDKDNLFTLMCSDRKPYGTYPSSAFNKFPCSENDSVGTIELKAAWRVFDDSLDKGIRSKYYTTTRTFDVETSESIDGKKTKVKVDVALVGFHVVQKTSNTAWIWATFEHIDNVPDANNKSQLTSGPYNLYSSDCKENCNPNTPYVQEPYLWRNEFPHAVTKINNQIKEQIPSQITRLVPIPPIAQSLNSEWRKKLAEVPKKLAEVPNSVWQNYQLIGVQWLQNPYVPYKTGPGGREVTPNQLANVTLEPYVQKGNPGNSCIACHSLATLKRLPEYPQNLEERTHADFSFLLRNAK